MKIIDVSKMDRKQREDAINEVSERIYRHQELHHKAFKLLPTIISSHPLYVMIFHFLFVAGTCAQSYATSIYHYIQRVLYGQAMPMHSDGLR